MLINIRKDQVQVGEADINRTGDDFLGDPGRHNLNKDNTWITAFEGNLRAAHLDVAVAWVRQVRHIVFSL